MLEGSSPHSGGQGQGCPLFFLYPSLNWSHLARPVLRPPAHQHLSVDMLGHHRTGPHPDCHRRDPKWSGQFMNCPIYFESCELLPLSRKRFRLRRSVPIVNCSDGSAAMGDGVIYTLVCQIDIASRDAYRHNAIRECVGVACKISNWEGWSMLACKRRDHNWAYTVDAVCPAFSGSMLQSEHDPNGTPTSNAKTLPTGVGDS